MSSESDSFSPLASVVYLGIPGFTRQPVAGQATLRRQLDDAVVAATAPLHEADRIVLDAPDGAAIVILSRPCDALAAGQRALAAAADDAFGVGINHGPVTLLAAERNDSRLIGDAIDAAMSIAGFAPPGGLLVSRSFRDALAQSAPELAGQLQPAGTFTDVHVRAHELFSLDTLAARAQTRRRLAFAALAGAGILALGVGARLAWQGLEEYRQPAVLVFDIRPQGDIYVDGVMKGKAPAVTRLQVPAGNHTLEVRHGRFPPFVTEVNMAPGEEMQVKHSFLAPATRRNRGLLERLKFW
ncbi:MAG: PEGA domain-containing protein [Betaproteobacteria bacterium]